VIAGSCGCRRPGCFHGNSTEPIAGKHVKSVELPQSAHADAVKFLEDAGIDEFLMFPDLDGLGRHLNRKYRIS